MSEINFDEALKVYNNRERIIEHQSEEYEDVITKYREIFKNFQAISDEVFQEESALAKEKWKNFETRKIVLSYRGKFDLNLEGLIPKTRDFLKTDKTKNLQNLIYIGENISTNIKERDSYMDIGMLQAQGKEFDKKKEFAIEKTAMCKDQYNLLKQMKVQPTKYEIPLKKYYLEPNNLLFKTK